MIETLKFAINVAGILTLPLFLLVLTILLTDLVLALCVIVRDAVKIRWNKNKKGTL